MKTKHEANDLTVCLFGGWPRSSQDVGFLAKMLSDLRNQGEKQTGKPIESAGVALLNLIALCQRDL